MPVFLDATPSRNADGQIQWTLCNNPPGGPPTCGGPPNYQDVALQQGAGATPFTITIRDPQNLGVKFAADPMWVQPGPDNCPQAQVFDSQGQIQSVQRVSDTQIKFTDLNNNTAPLTLTYSLQFVGAPALDPDIKNGGTQIGTGLTATTEFIIGVAVIALLVLAWFGFRNYRQRSVRE